MTLSDIKADPAFAGWDLLRNGRLGVVPVPEPMWRRVLALAEREVGEVEENKRESTPRTPRRARPGAKEAKA